MEWRQCRTVGMFESSAGHKLCYAKMLAGWGWHLSHVTTRLGDNIGINREISPFASTKAIEWANSILPLTEDQKFWVVWNPEGGIPMKRHAYLHEAKKEAERLAGQHLSTDFYVLRVVGKARYATPMYVEIQPTAFDRRELKAGEGC